MFTMTVPASKPGKTYTIRKVADDVWTCDCPDHLYRAGGAPYVCKHIGKILVSLAAFSSEATLSKGAKELIKNA